MKIIKNMLLGIINKISYTGIFLEILKILSLLLILGFYVFLIYLLLFENELDTMSKFCELGACFICSFIFSVIVSGAKARRTSPQKDIKALNDKYLRFIVFPLLETVDIYEKIPLFFSLILLVLLKQESIVDVINIDIDKYWIWKIIEANSFYIAIGILLLMFFITLFNEILLTMATTILRISEHIEENESKSSSGNTDYELSLGKQASPALPSQTPFAPENMPQMPKPPLPPQQKNSVEDEIVDSGISESANMTLSSAKRTEEAEPEYKKFFEKIKKGITVIVIAFSIIAGSIILVKFWNPYIKILLMAKLGIPSAQYQAGKYYADRYKINLRTGKADNYPDDIQLALKWHTKAADKGNADSQDAMGTLYDNGYGVKQDYAKAMEWYAKAASNGSSKAQCNIGFLYYYGHGVEQDYSKAVEWFKKSAENNNIDCLAHLGMMYEAGYGVEKNYSKASELFKKAADNGSAFGEYYMGRMYYNGNGVDKNYITAKEWFEKSAAQDYSEADFSLGYMYNFAKGVPKDYKRAFELYSKSAEKGNASAQYNLAVMYSQGQYVEKDENKEVSLLKLSAANGFSYAQLALGKYHYTGYGDSVEQSKQKAAELYEKSAEQGNLEAQEIVAKMYYTGDGIAKDTVKASKYYSKAAEQGSAEAQLRLADMFYAGIGVEQDYKKAFELYEKAVEQENAEAEYKLGYIYYYGRLPSEETIEDNNFPFKQMTDSVKGLALMESASQKNSADATKTLAGIYMQDKNYSKALVFYKQAAAFGDTDAKMKIAKMYKNGTGVAKDKELALQWYEDAAKDGNVEAIKEVAYTYLSKHRFAEAKDLFEELFEKGYVPAAYEIGNMYLYGEGVQENIRSAYSWYEKGEAGNDVRSILMLGLMDKLEFGRNMDYLNRVKKIAMSENISNAGFMKIFKEVGKKYISHKTYKDCMKEAGSSEFVCEYFAVMGADAVDQLL